MEKNGEYTSDDTIDWLLEDENPSVKYFTLIDLRGKRIDEPEVRTAKEHIMNIGIVPKILEKQKPGGYWGNTR